MAAPRRTRGGQLALRQTRGFMRSIAMLAGLALPVPDLSTLSGRGKD
ncbi:MAG: transposase [Rhizobium sp.]|nr:transposase [Rhizobium sp.]